MVTVSPTVPNGETVTLEDASNGNAVVGSGTLIGGTVTISVSTLTAGTTLFAVYGGNATYAASQSAQVVQVVISSNSLGTYIPLEGPISGTDSDIVANRGAWTATSNVSWLHTTSSGTGNGLAIFTFDANMGATRSGTLTIAGQTLTVTQAGSSYVAANPVTTLVSSGLNSPYGRGGGRLGQRLLRRYRQQRDQGVERHRRRRSPPWSPRG